MGLLSSVRGSPTVASARFALRLFFYAQESLLVEDAMKINTGGTTATMDGHSQNEVQIPIAQAIPAVLFCDRSSQDRS